MTFTVQRLVNNRAIVDGTDVHGKAGQLVVSTEEWDMVNANSELELAKQDFDAEVEKFFAPLVEAQAKLDKKLEMPEDPINYLVLDEGTEGVEHQERVVHKLSHDSVILRLIESGDSDRLVWVNGGLEVLAAAPKKSRARKA